MLIPACISLEMTLRFLSVRQIVDFWRSWPQEN